MVPTWYLDQAKALLSMVACTAFHCAYEDHNLAIEDTFVMDDGGAIIIRRAPDEFGPEGKVTRCRR